MLWGNEKRICFLYAITPVHAGAGQALKAVDLPIQRERHTGWPIVQASGIKGSLRDWCEQSWKRNGGNSSLADRIFGKAGEEGQSWAGSITVTDARIFLFPVRSNVAPFVHVTCPAVLKRFKEDLELSGETVQVADRLSLNDNNFVVLHGDVPDSIVLEDMVVNRSDSSEEIWSKWLEDRLGSELDRVVIVSDNVFGILVRMATEVQAHIAIEDSTGTAKDGSLRYQEYLPSDTVLYFVAFFSGERNSKKGNSLSAREVAQKVTTAVSSHIQIGGDFTLGKGICKVRWVGPKNTS